MPIKVIKSSYNSGEISEQLAGRTDLQKFHSGCSQVSNGITLPWGGIQKRPGTEYIATAKGVCRVISFSFSATDSMIIEAGNQYMRFYKDDIEETITKASVSNWAINTDYSINDIVYDSVGTTGYYYCKVAHTSDATAFSNDTANWVALTEDPNDSDNLIYEIYTPYSATEIFDVHLTSSADVIYLAHPDYAPRKLSRLADNNWSLEVIEFTGGPFLTENTNSSHLLQFARTGGTARSGYYYPAGATGTLTATGGHAPFLSQHVGSYWLLKHTRGDNDLTTPDNDTNTTPTGAGIRIKGDFSFNLSGFASGETVKLWRKEGNGSWQVYRAFSAATAYSETEEADDVYYTFTRGGGTPTSVDELVAKDQINRGIVKVTGYTSSTVVDVEVVTPVYDNNSGTSPTTAMWAEGAWNEYRGYPATVTFYEDRLWWAGTTNNPQTLWGSRSGRYENHESGVADDNAINITINDNDVSNIVWIASKKVLIAGTTNKEYAISAQNPDDPITPTDATAKPQSSYGSDNIQPVILNDGLFYIQRLGRRTWLMNFSYQTESFESTDATKLAPHMFESRPTNLAVQRTPDNIIWVVRSDGQLATFIVNTDEEIVAWTRQVTGSTLDRATHKFKSVAIIPGSTEDDIYVSTERVINGVTVYYIEKFATRYIDQLDEAMMLDCAKVTSSTNAAQEIVYAADTVRCGIGICGSGPCGA